MLAMISTQHVHWGCSIEELCVHGGRIASRTRRKTFGVSVLKKCQPTYGGVNLDLDDNVENTALEADV